MENQRLKQAVQSLKDVNTKIGYTTATLDGLNHLKQQLECNLLPELFAEVGIQNLTTDDGSRLMLSVRAAGTLPKAQEARQKAIEWLVANGLGDLVECTLRASWARGDRETAEQALLLVRGIGSTPNASLDEGVNPATLGKVAKDRIAAGQECPLDLLGIVLMPRVRFTTTRTGD